MGLAIEARDVAERLVKAHQGVYRGDFGEGGIDGGVRLGLGEPVHSHAHARSQQGPRPFNARQVRRHK